MKRRIVLLTGREEALFFEQLLLQCNPRLSVLAAHSLADLSACIERYDGAVRLIAFLTSTIIPPDLLSSLRVTPYNIHPGPPEYPGSHPESFAIWDGAPSFGVTAHEMTMRVDEGPIVAVDRFPMPPLPDRTALSVLTYSRAIELFAAVAMHCAGTDAPMQPIDEEWSPPKNTRDQFRALCRPQWRVGPGEMERLSRACGDDLVERLTATG